MIKVPYARQDVSQEDIETVVDVLRSDFLTQGPIVPMFERAVSERCNAEYGVAVNSGTSALHIACLALGLGPGDWLWTSPNTFVASANCGLYCGAKVDFVDIDSRTYNLSVDALSAKLERAEREGRLPKVVIPVHFGGQPCEMEKICQLGKRYGFKIIEDASHAIGARYKNEPVGNCEYSDITVFSFHPVKIITTGEGGMAVTNDAVLAERMARLRTHGITRDVAAMQKVSHGPWYYEQVELGFNNRMTDLQAALGLSQLQRLDDFLTKRREIAEIYNEALSDLPLILPKQQPNTATAWHLYVIQVDPMKTDVERSTLFAQLRAVGIGVNVHYIPVYSQPYYVNHYDYLPSDYPNAEGYYKRVLTIPLFPKMLDEDVKYVVQSARAFEGW